MILRCIPAHAASSTATARAARANAKFARPKKRTPIPAAVDPSRPQKANLTAAVIAHGAGEKIPGALFLKEKSCYTIPDTQYMRKTRWQLKKNRK
jgi:hypothetical protein